MKTAVITLWLAAVASAVCALFWYNEWKYQLPTPVPKDYSLVSTGTRVHLPEQFKTETNKPLFLHFFNPDCPCSRFNMTHFKSLVKDYGKQAEFMIVVLNNEKYNEKQIKEKFGLDLPVSFDASIATACGVYSTPQAVILDKDRRLYYRGNYNKSRYCTDKKTSYAQTAISTLINQQPAFSFDRYALTAFGCQLPQCTK